MDHTDVLIAGAGPTGLTAAIELARRGIGLRIVDPLPNPPQYAKAVGVQPRTLEVFEGMGVRRSPIRHTDRLTAHLALTFGASVSTPATPRLR